MNSLNIFLIKSLLNSLNMLIISIATIFFIETPILQALIFIVVIIGIIYFTYKDRKQIKNENYRMIYKGFNFKNSMIYMVLGAIMIFLFYTTNKSLGYFFFGIAFFIKILEDSIILFQFDLEKGLISDLIPNRKFKISETSLTYQKSEVTLTDQKGFVTISEAELSQENWQQFMNIIKKMEVK